MIEAKNLTKTYPLFRSPAQRAQYFLSMGYAGKPGRLEVLRDISFSVGKGESVGIIGENGAGKSTLLKLVAGASPLTYGSLEVKGRVAALLELGVGFYPELTGRENISLYLRLFQTDGEQPGALVSSRISLIEQFAELGDYFDRPVRTYSTGMQMRLAFSAASFVEPEILIVDEALAVGDAYFQQKCLDKIDAFRKEGVSILFVSHSMPLVEMFCNRAVFLQDGQIAASGAVTDVVREYEQYVAKSRGLLVKKEGGGDVEECVVMHNAPSPEAIKSPDSSDGNDSVIENCTASSQTIGSVYGNGKIRFTNIATADEDGNIKSRFRAGEVIRIILDYEAARNYPDAVFGVSIFRIDGIYVTGTNNYEIDPYPLQVEKGKGTAIVDIGPMNLHNGVFFLTTSVYTEPQAPL